MNETVNNEISNLFQELIVSKIKLIVDELEKRIGEIEDSETGISESINKLPKQSGIKRIVGEEKEAIINHLDSCFEKINTEKYLKDIVAFLKKQYSFQEQKTLCEFLDSMSVDIGQQINSVIVSQNNLDGKIQEVNEILSQYQEKVINLVISENASIWENMHRSFEKVDERHTNIESCIGNTLTCEKENGKRIDETIQKINENDKKINETIQRIDENGKKIDETIQRIDENGTKLDENSAKFEIIFDRLKAFDDISSILDYINTSIGLCNEMNTSLREDLAEVKDAVAISQESCNAIQERIDVQAVSMDKEYSKMDRRLKLMTILNYLSIAGIVILAILHFIF